MATHGQRSRDYKADSTNSRSTEDIQFQPSYVVDSLWGKLRIAQVVMSFLSGATASGIRYIHNECSGAQFQFHVFVSWITFVNVVIILFLHLMNLYRRIPLIFHRVELHLVLCCSVILAMLISASITAGYSWCGWRNLQKGLAISSAFFGFVCIVVFIAELVLHLKDFKCGSSTEMPAVSAPNAGQ